MATIKRKLKLNLQLPEEYMNTPVTEMSFLGRTENCLLHNRIQTFGQLIDNYDKIKTLRGLGTACIKDINSKILELELEYLLDHPAKIDKYVTNFLKLNDTQLKTA